MLAQEASDSIAEVSANEELAPTENDSAPRWLSKSPRGGAERVHEVEQKEAFRFETIMKEWPMAFRSVSIMKEWPRLVLMR